MKWSRVQHGSIVAFLFYWCKSHALLLFHALGEGEFGATVAAAAIWRGYVEVTEKKLMATKSTIEWTEMTWNPVTGCTRVSEGCRHCYAERMALRLQAMGNRRYVNGFGVTLHDDLVDLPRQLWQPRLIFVNSMSDLFHEEVPEEFIARVFETMAACPQHTFQVLTKRSRRLEEMAMRLPWPNNVWMGVSVEGQRVLGRIDDLRQVPACLRFLSCEPLLGSWMIWTLRESPGLLSAANPAPALARCNTNGCGRS